MQESPVATPDKQRKIIFCFVKVFMVEVPPRKNAIPHERIKMTTVRMAVAKSVSTPLIPILAKIAVRAAKSAASKAYIYHMVLFF